MNKRIAFLVYRSPMMIALAPVIIEILKRSDMEVLIFTGPANYNSKDTIAEPTPDHIDFPGIDKVKVINFDDISDLEMLLVQFKIDILMTTNFRCGSTKTKQKPIDWLNNIKNKGILIYCLQWYADYLVITPELMKFIDKIFVYSQKMIDIYFQSYPQAIKEELLKKFIIVGSPVFDCVSALRQQKNVILKKYRLPINKKIVLLITAPFNFWEEANKLRACLLVLKKRQWEKLKDIFFYFLFKNIVRNLKNWCRKNDACLVVKSRTKHYDAEYIRKSADYFIKDLIQWYPHITLELLSIADITIGVGSSSAMEAVYCGVYNISILPEAFFRETNQPGSAGSELFFRPPFFTYPNVTQSCGPKEFNQFLNSHTIDDFKIKDQSARESYIKLYAGFNDGKAAKRIIDLVE